MTLERKRCEQCGQTLERDGKCIICDFDCDALVAAEEENEKEK